MLQQWYLGIIFFLKNVQNQETPMRILTIHIYNRKILICNICSLHIMMKFPVKALYIYIESVAKHNQV